MKTSHENNSLREIGSLILLVVTVALLKLHLPTTCKGLLSSLLYVVYVCMQGAVYMVKQCLEWLPRLSVLLSMSILPQKPLFSFQYPKEIFVPTPYPHP